MLLGWCFLFKFLGCWNFLVGSFWKGIRLRYAHRVFFPAIVFRFRFRGLGLWTTSFTCRPQMDGLQATKIARQAMGFGDAQPPRRGDSRNLRDMNSQTKKACVFFVRLGLLCLELVAVDLFMFFFGLLGVGVLFCLEFCFVWISVLYVLFCLDFCVLFWCVNVPLFCVLLFWYGNVFWETWKIARGGLNGIGCKEVVEVLNLKTSSYMVLLASFFLFCRWWGWENPCERRELMRPRLFREVMGISAFDSGRNWRMSEAFFFINALWGRTWIK